MKDIVIVPTYFRPEYLALCLEHISAAKGDRDIEVRVYHDMPRRSVGADISESWAVAVDRSLALGLDVKFVARASHTAVGNTLNFLAAYQSAYFSDVRYVYLIEDDVFVGEDFFDWHEAVQERNDYFCSVAWHCIRNPRVNKTEDPNAIIESAIDFSSIGVCWKRKALEPVVRHASSHYYNAPGQYLGVAFPDSPIPPNRWVEQAGLIMRVLLAGKGSRVVAWSGRPRVAHVGVNGYHRLSGPVFTGSLSERIEALRKALLDGTFSRQTQWDDINALPSYKPWEASSLYVIQKF